MRNLFLIKININKARIFPLSIDLIQTVPAGSESGWTMWYWTTMIIPNGEY